MQEPAEIAKKLHGLGTISSIKVEYRPTGCDTAETYCVISNGKEELNGLWDTYRDYLDVGVGHNYVASLKSGASKHVQEWILFERANKAELKEYERLRAKFGNA